MIEKYLGLLQLFLIVLLLVFLSIIGSRISSININNIKIYLKGLLGDLQFIVVKPKGNNNNKKDRSVVGDGILLMILYKFYLLYYTATDTQLI